MWQLMILLLSKCHYNKKKGYLLSWQLKTIKSATNNPEVHSETSGGSCVSAGSGGIPCPLCCEVMASPSHWSPLVLSCPSFHRGPTQMPGVIPLNGMEKGTEPPGTAGSPFGWWGQLSSSLPWLCPELVPALIHPCRKVMVAFLSDKNFQSEKSKWGSSPF